MLKYFKKRFKIMNVKRKLLSLLACSIFLSGCDMLTPNFFTPNEGSNSSDSIKDSYISESSGGHTHSYSSEDESYHSENESRDMESSHQEESSESIHYSNDSGLVATVSIGDHLRDFLNIADGEVVAFTGRITGFGNVRPQNRAFYAFVTDPDDNFSILLYFSQYCPFYDYSLIGRKIEVIGQKQDYHTIKEVANPDYFISDDEPLYIPPTDTNWHDENLDYSQHIHEYTHVTGVISAISGSRVDLEGISAYLYFVNVRYLGEPPVVGDTISFDAWLFPYDASYEFAADVFRIAIVNRQ